MFSHTPVQSPRGRAGFSLVELMIVILIISILMTMGSVMINGLTGGKSVTSALTNVEALVDEARTLAVSRGTNTRLMVDVNDNTKPDRYLRRIVVAYQETDPNTGKPVPDKWTLSSRGFILPDKVFFSRTFSKKDHMNNKSLDTTYDLTSGKTEYQGKYVYYEFNSEGICQTPGASFIVGSGVRPNGREPQIVGAAKRDFGGFVIWRNGRTSLFRSPEHMGLPKTITNF